MGVESSDDLGDVMGDGVEAAERIGEDRLRSRLQARSGITEQVGVAGALAVPVYAALDLVDPEGYRRQ